MTDSRNTPESSRIELPLSYPVEVAALRNRRPTRFKLEPDAETRAALAALLGAVKLRKLRFEGELRPLGRQDWELAAHLGATVVQECVVSLEPVTTRIDEEVRRRYLAEMPQPEGDEVEMPEDDSAEQLEAVIEIGAAMTEALALALPLFPRADGAEPEETAFTEPGKEPMRDADAMPFAGLAALRDKLKP